MRETKSIILEQYLRYPKMEMQDFIKMIYQNSFGPKHMRTNPSLETTKKYIEEELKNTIEYPATHQIEYIGNDYYRVSLLVINHGLMTVDQFSDAFYQSMIDSPIIDDENINFFITQLKMICEMVEEKEIDLDVKDCELLIEEYLDLGIRPMHHTDIFKENYHPHYRVIHKSILRKYLEV